MKNIKFEGLIAAPFTPMDEKGEVVYGRIPAYYDFLKKTASAIPNLAGIKYTHEDFMDFQSCINFMDGKYDMLWGRDENLLSALVLGTRSGLGSTFNYAAPLYYKLIKALEMEEEFSKCFS